MDSEQSVSGNAVPRQPRGHEDGVTVWKHLWMGWARSKRRYVTISRPRLVVVGPGRDNEGRFLKRTIRLVEHKTLLHVVC